MKKAYEIATQTENVDEIKKRVRHLLRAAEVGDKLPTPKKDIIECAELVAVGKLDLEQYEESWPKEQWNAIKSIFVQTFSKIKGFVHLGENIIYVDPNLHPASIPFVTYHEVTHRILPAHKILLNPHLDDDLTLDPEFARGLEIEANIGATLILFQVDRFAKEIKDYSLGLTSAILFAQRYEASFHSAFRNYVKVNHRSCALLVLNKPDEILDRECFPMKYALDSEEFHEQFGRVDWGNYFFEGHPIYDTILKQNGDQIRKGNLQLKDRLGFKVECTIEIFHNTYNYFVLCYPNQKSGKGKKLVVVKSLGKA